LKTFWGEQQPSECQTASGGCNFFALILCGVAVWTGCGLEWCRGPYSVTQKYHLRGLAAYRWGRVIGAQTGRSDRANTGPSGKETSLARCRLPKGVFTIGLADSTGGG